MPEKAPPVRLIWATPNGEELLTCIAKVVSNPLKQDEPAPRLIHYLMERGHWSPFEMVNLCFELKTTRDIGRQFLRHWTMRPQEFSPRYQGAVLSATQEVELRHLEPEDER